jgi:hypothetical protein
MSPKNWRQFASIMVCGFVLVAVSRVQAFGGPGCVGGCGTCASCGCGQTYGYSYPMYGAPCGYRTCGGCGGSCCLFARQWQGCLGGCRSCGHVGYGYGGYGYGGYSYGGCGNPCRMGCGYPRSCFGGCGGCGSCGFARGGCGCGGCGFGCGSGCRTCGGRGCGGPVYYAPAYNQCVPFGYYSVGWTNLSAPAYSNGCVGVEPPLAPGGNIPQYMPAPSAVPAPAPSDVEPLPPPRRLEPSHTSLGAGERLPILQPAGYLPNR